MSLVRLGEKTPDVYTRESRDFQLLCNVFDCFNNGVKSDIDSMMDVLKTAECPSRLLGLLATRIGFFSDSELTDSDLRMILKAYPYILKNKGSELAVKQCIILFQRMRKINIPSYISIVNKDENGNNVYKITIGLSTSFIDVYVLDELIKHILPTGYTVSYVFYNTMKQTGPKLEYWQNLIKLYGTDETASKLRKGVELEETEYKELKERLYGLLNAIEIVAEDKKSENSTEVNQ